MKRKISFSIFNLLGPSQAEVVKLQSIWAGLSAIITGATFIQAEAHHALIAALACAVIDKAICCFRFEEIKTNE
jgi:hypothetical protein